MIKFKDDISSTKTEIVEVSAKTIEQALAEYLSSLGYSGVMQDSTRYEFKIRGGNLDNAHDIGQILDGCVVTISEG